MSHGYDSTAGDMPEDPPGQYLSRRYVVRQHDIVQVEGGGEAVVLGVMKDGTILARMVGTDDCFPLTGVHYADDR